MNKALLQPLLTERELLNNPEAGLVFWANIDFDAMQTEMIKEVVDGHGNGYRNRIPASKVFSNPVTDGCRTDRAVKNVGDIQLASDFTIHQHDPGEASPVSHLLYVSLHKRSGVYRIPDARGAGFPRREPGSVPNQDSFECSNVEATQRSDRDISKPDVRIFHHAGKITPMPISNKAELRALHASLRPRSSVGLTEQLAALVEKLGVKTVASYHPLRTEPDTSEFNRQFARSGNLLLPRVDGENIEFAYGDLAPGSLGIMEPTGNTFPIDAIELILVPALAIDAKGNRLGKGRGYYDRVLKTSVATAVGVIFDGELVEQIKAEEHDVRMQYAITPTELHRFKQ
jgi:5-formyltetrahydrofolate cyclo-ligase